ncbi:unnamed protein product [Thlaspi arvense]|uniref:Uncharacterized protein n=1 Tax=Thlaspi arvense TaxID=13288 RepID=A0AAU9S8G4_THLAR|nr:unnamed protein product [Thlaspi arvense]
MPRLSSSSYPENMVTTFLKAFLSLYEASYLALEGENILDEARAFTSVYLKGLQRKINSGLMEEVNHALELPRHYRMFRPEARWYLNANDKRRDANRVLLDLAKLDFNMVQSILQSELQDVARVGMVECFFWAAGMVFEPQLNECRKGLAKVVALLTTIDDVYDVYGSLEELQLFTHAVERWDLDALETLRDYMKPCFLTLYNTVNEMAQETHEEQSVNTMPHHLSRAVATGVVLLTHAYFLLSKDITKNSLENLDLFHPLLLDSSLIFRLCNDLDTSKAELEGRICKFIIVLHEGERVSEEVARKHIRSLTDETWKKMNKHRLANDSPFGKLFTEMAINLARNAECAYQKGDGHRDPDTHAKNRISSVVFQPLELTE